MGRLDFFIQAASNNPDASNTTDAVFVARSKGSEEREASSQLFGRLSLNLMRGNALMLSSRHQDEDIPLAEIDGVE